MIGFGLRGIIEKKQIHNTTPSQILYFQPVCKGSDPYLVRIAQAELCRHGIDVGEVDGDCGKKTGLGMCEYLVMLENGYKPHTMFERNPNDEEKESLKAKAGISREKINEEGSGENRSRRANAFD